MSTQPATFGGAAVPPGISLPLAPELAKCRFSVDEYHRMIESGILTENDRVELVDGWIIEMPPIGPAHFTATRQVSSEIGRRLPAGWTLRPQGLITLAGGEPEPDVVVAKGGPKDYATQHPRPADIALVIEVSDATLKFDRTQKAAAYAEAGIPEYWIVNLIDRQLEVHREPQAAATGPEYRKREVIGATGAVPLMIAGQLLAELTVADLLA